MKKNPSIRFNGFTDTWEQRAFFENIKNTIDFRGRTPKKLGMDWSETGYLALSALNVKNGYIDPFADAHYGDEKLYRKWMGGKELKKGQVLFTTEAPMGNVAQVPDDKGYILSQRTICFDVDKEKITNDFLAVSLKSPMVFNELTSLSSGGTAKGVSQKSLSGLNITVPKSIEEQNQIGSFFKQLDKAIALHQRQLDNYKELKKTMLQQIFNKELRFKDENGNDYPDWRKTLLKKVAKIYDGTHQTPNYKNKGIKFVSVENIKNLEGTTKYISEEDYKKDFKEVPEFGDILMTRIGDVGTSTVVRTYEPLAYYVSLALIKCKNINSEYLNHYIEGEQFQNELWKKILHVAFPKKINKGDIGECMIIYPCVAEQQKIADFLSAIDKQLEKVEQKVELLKEQKKGLMQQMFI